MMRLGRVGERQVWIVAVAVLATSLAWFGALAVVLVLVASAPQPPAALVVARALVRVVVRLVPLARLALPMPLLAAGLSLAVVRAAWRGAPLERRMHRA